MVDFSPPTEQEIARVRADVGTDEKSIKEALSILKEWLRSQPHLPDDIDELRMERMYINCKCSLERAKKSLDAYFSLRTRMPQLLQHRDTAGHQLAGMMETIQLFPMPLLTPEGYRVHISTGFHPDPDKFSPDGYVKLLLMMLEVRLAEDYVLGDIYVFDCHNFGVQQLASLGMARVRAIELCLTMAYCSRIKGIHFVNASQLIDLLYKMVVAVLSSKLAKRVHLHPKGSETLLQHIPRENLPNELGGTAGSSKDIWESWRRKLESYHSWFLQQDALKSDELKRPAGQQQLFGEDTLFGCDGSFRKLQVD